METISRQDRAKAAAGAVSLQALLGFALITGFAVTNPESAREALKLFTVEAPEPPPPVREPARRPERRRNRPEGGSPPNLRARPTEVVAPKPAILLPVPTPIPAAEIPGPGSASWAGAADVPGPGTGTGGSGRGTGTGDGDGDGEGGGAMTPPRRIPRKPQGFGLSGRCRRGWGERKRRGALPGRGRRPGQRLPGGPVERKRAARTRPPAG